MGYVQVKLSTIYELDVDKSRQTSILQLQVIEGD